MLLSVVNLQEAYAKALLVDRTRSPSAARERRSRRTRVAARRVQLRRAPDLRAAQADGAAADPVAEFRTSGYSERRRARSAPVNPGLGEG